MAGLKHKHLSFFKIEGFKNLNSIELTDIGLFNVIVGDNNVGKTNLLEALAFEEENYTNHLQNLATLCSFRYKESAEHGLKNDYYKSFFNYTADNPEIKYSFKFSDDNEIKLLKIERLQKENITPSEIEEIQKSTITTVNPLTLENSLKITSEKSTVKISSTFSEHRNYEGKHNYIPFIPSNLSHGGDLSGYYSDFIAIDKSLKNKLLNYLGIFFEDLDSIELGKSNLKDELEIHIGLKNINILQPLSMFGDGFIKYFRILLEIFVMKNRRLMIDEIDNGIHHERQKEFLKNIVLAAISSNTQIFCTTHSLECLKSIKAAFEDSELIQYKDIFRNFSLEKNKTGEIRAFKYDFENFKNSIQNNIEIR